MSEQRGLSRWRRSMGVRFRCDRYVIEEDKPLVIGRLFCVAEFVFLKWD